MDKEMILCRSCGNQKLITILNLGELPLANALKTQNQLTLPEKKYPLTMVFCPRCSLVQITETVNPEELFDEYLYFSSYSDTMVQHAKSLMESLIVKRHLTDKNLVIEIASNDGYLLQFFKEKKIQILGIEPAKNIAEVANNRGIPTLSVYFNKQTASLLFKQGMSADIILGLNVVAHIADLNNFFEGVKLLLKPHGMIVFEFPYIKDLIRNMEFDTIYHEHLCYFSCHSIQYLLVKHQLDIIDVEELPIHGGSLRVYAAHHETRKPETNVAAFLEKEKKEGMLTPSYYIQFASSIMKLKHETVALLVKLKDENKKIIGYGAAAKGSTLLNFYGIGHNIIDYITDRNPYKQGKFMSGTQIPIVHPDKIKETKPDYILILPWNIQDEIMSQLDYVRTWGGKFIIPIPDIRVI